ncbi:MAG TPA: Hpt domain-containing protein, partial [Desulfomonilia bacterium]|nr:Hpt domain-containing protein [Desulfomonilia bacterium]
KWDRRTEEDAPGTHQINPRIYVVSPEPTASRETTPVFDSADLLDRFDGDEGLARMILDTYFRDIPGTIDRLKAAIDKSDMSEIGLHAHTIKGASGNAGGMAMRELAFMIEKAGKSGDLDTASLIMSELLHQFNLFKVTAEKSGWVKREGI